MWKGKRLLKKSGAIVLALALTVSPLGAMAAEEERTTEVQSSAVVPTDGVNLSESQKDSASEKDAAKKQGGTTASREESEAGKPQTSDAQTTEPSEAGKTEDSAEETTEDTTENVEAGRLPNAFATVRQYDTTQPVIEKIIFDQNGATLTQKDTLKIGVEAYDAESGIGTVMATIQLQDAEPNQSYSTQIPLEQNADNPKLYEGSYAIEGTVYESGYISNIYVADKAGNVKNEYLGSDKYTFKIEPKSLESVTVSDLKFSNSGATLTPDGAGADFSFKVNSEVDLSNGRLYVRFKSADHSSTYDYYAGQSSETEGIYTGAVYAHDWLEPGKWSFDSIVYEEQSKEITVQTGVVGDIWYEFTGKGDKEAPKLLSVEVDKNGQVVKPGETVSFKLKASDDVTLNTDYAQLQLSSSITEIAPNYHYVDLKYNSATDMFEGQFAVEDTTYPCEWYIAYIDIEDAAGNNVENNLWEQGHPYYFQVQNKETFVNPTYQVTVSFQALGENGYWEQIQAVTKENVERRSTLKELGIEFPEAPQYPGLTFQGFQALGENGYWEQIQAVTKENVERRSTLKELGIEFPEAPQYPGLTFQGWADYNGNEINENTQIVQNGYLTVYPVYDKALVSIQYGYWDASGDRVDDTEIKIMSKDTLVKDVVAEAMKKELPSQYPGLTFQGWETYVSDENATVGNQYSISMRAVYDKHVISFMVSEELVQYPGLTFQGWETYVSDENATVGNQYSISMRAVYDKHVISFMVSEELVGTDIMAGYLDPEKLEVVYTQAVEPGDVVEIPVSSEEHGDYTWLTLTEEEKKAGSITIGDYDRIDYGYGSKMVGEGDVPPTEPENPVTPGAGQLPEESVQQIVDDLKNVAAGETYRIDMGGATVVPKDILETIKGKDINIQLNMGGYTWTINGKDVTASDLKDINMEVKFNTNAVPSETVKKLAGDNPTQQLSLTHEGDFGFKATLTMNAGAEYAGKHGNLFWYDSNHKMVFIDAGEIQGDGSVSLDFSHASDYVLVMADTVLGGNGTGTDNRNETSVKTGDTNSFAGILILLVMSMLAGVGVIIYRRKTN